MLLNLMTTNNEENVQCSRFYLSLSHLQRNCSQKSNSVPYICILHKNNRSLQEVNQAQWHLLQDQTIQRGMRNTIKTLVLVAICFVACWSWNQIYYLMMNLGFREDYASPFYHFTVIAVFLNSCVNPVIYSLKYEPFKRAAFKLFCTKLFGKQKFVLKNRTTRSISPVF